MEATPGKKLNRLLTAVMVLVGMTMGLLLVSPYAIPLQANQQAGAGTPGAFTFQSVCTACHQVDRVQNYQGSKHWPEVIKLMEEFGAFMTEDEAKEIEEYLQATYPR